MLSITCIQCRKKLQFKITVHNTEAIVIPATKHNNMDIYCRDPLNVDFPLLSPHKSAGMSGKSAVGILPQKNVLNVIGV